MQDILRVAIRPRRNRSHSVRKVGLGLRPPLLPRFGRARLRAMQHKAHPTLTRREAVARARLSPKFRRWARGRVLVHVKYHEVSPLKHRDSSPLKSPAVERHYVAHGTSEHVGFEPGDDPAAFRDESGVIVLGNTESRRKRRYRTFRIPESVVFRVHKKIATP